MLIKDFVAAYNGLVPAEEMILLQAAVEYYKYYFDNVLPGTTDEKEFAGWYLPEKIDIQVSSGNGGTTFGGHGFYSVSLPGGPNGFDGVPVTGVAGWEDSTFLIYDSKVGIVHELGHVILGLLGITHPASDGSELQLAALAAVGSWSITPDLLETARNVRGAFGFTNDSQYVEGFGSNPYLDSVRGNILNWANGTDGSYENIYNQQRDFYSMTGIDTANIPPAYRVGYVTHPGPDANGTDGSWQTYAVGGAGYGSMNLAELIRNGRGVAWLGNENGNVMDIGDGLTYIDGGGNDYIDGGFGDDTLGGGDGDDILIGGKGKDTLKGGDGDDELKGGDDDDTLEGGIGEDTLEGGDGDDKLDGGDDDDTLDGGIGDDELKGGDGVDTLDGGDDDDTLDGGIGDDELKGGDGKDTLEGGDGSDTLDGGAGDDTLKGGEGIDILQGGAGRDTYYADDGETVDDSDGYGSVYVGSILLTGGKWDKEAGAYLSSDKSIRYTMTGGGIVAKTPEGTVYVKAPGLTKKGLPNMGIPLEKDDPDEDTASGFNGGQSAIFIWRSDPLTLDLNGNGIETVPLTPPPILFDHTGLGIKQGTGWIAPSDGLLVLDRNGNGFIDNGTELFGDSTPLYDAAGNVIGKARDGFAALAQQDSNLDGLVDAQDANWNNLRVWQDLNQDGISQTDELTTLDDQDIASINVGNTTHSLALPNGNQIADLGNFTYTDGRIANAGIVNNVADVNLILDTFHRTFTDTIPLTAQAELLPDMQGSGKVRDLQEAASLQTAAGQALSDALSHYSQATTREEQLAQIDKLITLWGATSGMGTMQSRAVDQGYTLTVRFGITPAQQQQLAALEAFNGRGYFKMPWEDRSSGPGAQQGLAVGFDGNPKHIGVSLFGNQTSLLDQAYAALKQSVYDTLLTQTRLKPYLDNIGVTQDLNNEFHLDFTAVHQAFIDSAASNPDKAVVDLIELNLYGKNNNLFADTAWPTQGWETLGEILNSTTLSPAILKTLADFNVGLDGQVQVPITWKDQILVAQETGSTLNGGSYNDILIGGAGDDTLNAGSGADILIGGAGDDELDGSWGNDTLQGGTGSDAMQGGYGNDTYLYNRGDGADTIVDSPVGWWGAVESNTVQFGAGITAADIAITYDSTTNHVVLVLNNGDNLIIGSPNEQYQKGDKLAIQQLRFTDGTTLVLDDYIQQNGLIQNGTDGADTLQGSESYYYADTLNGGAGDDVLNGGRGNDRLNGGTGDDTLNGGEGNDTLNGGLGNDVLSGGSGKDTYVYNLGDGADTIIDSTNASGWWYRENNTLSFGEGITLAMVVPSFNSSTQNVMLDLGNGDTIDIGTAGGLSVQKLLFADGSTVDVNTLIADQSLSQTGTEGADTLLGSNTWLYRDVLQGLGGDDVLQGLGGNDELDGGASNDVLEGGAGNDQLMGGEGADTLDGGDGSDTLQGGAGSDVLVGGSGSDAYVFNTGDGADTVVDSIETVTNWWGTTYITAANVLNFGAGITADMLTPRFDSSTQTVTLDLGSGDSIQIGTPNNFSIQTLQFADGSTQTLEQFLVLHGLTVDGTAAADVLTGSDSRYVDHLNGGAGNDTLMAGSGNDILTGGTGNDVLDGGEGIDTYVFNLGDGADIINDISGNNILELGVGITAAVILPRLDGVTGELRLDLGNVDSVVVGRYDASQSALRLSIQQINFADGTTTQLSNLLAQKGFLVEGDVFDDTLQGAMSNQNRMFGFDGNDMLTGGQRDDIQDGGTGNDLLNAGYGNDLLTGGLGVDVLAGGEGDDVYVYNLGDGADTIVDTTGSGQINTVRLGVGADVQGIEYQGDATGDILLHFVDGGSLRIAGVVADNVISTSSIQLFEFDGGTVLTAQQLLSNYTIQVNGTDGYWWDTTGDSLYGTNLADSIRGYDGNDTLFGGNGNDELDGGYGNDMLSGDGGDDLIYGGVGSDMLYGREGDDELDGGYGNDVLSGDAGNDYLYGADGNDILLGGSGNDELAGAWGNDVLQGGSGNDALVGAWGDDELQGGSGNDILEGATGNDMLAGGTGDDTYLFNLGDGEDRINDTAGTDVLSFGPGITYGDLTFTKTGVNLRISLSNGSDAIVIENWFTGTSTLNTLRFSDISTFDLTSISQSIVDQPVMGTDFDDTLLGSVYNDTLQGGEGNDTLIGGTADDVYRFNLNDGADQIYELSAMATVTGSDTIEFGTGITPDMLYLSLQVERLNEGVWNEWNLTAFPDANADLMLGDRQRQVLNIAIDNMSDNIRVMSGKGAVEKFRFADGSEYTWQQMFEMQGGGTVTDNSAMTYSYTNWNGYEYVPYTYVDAPQSVLDGTGLASTFNGGIGNDLMLGGMQNDAYVFNLGDGQDVIADFGGLDEIVFGTGITAADLTWNYAPASATPFMLSVGTGGDSIAIWGGEHGAIESFRFADDSVITFAELIDNQGGIVLEPVSEIGAGFYAGYYSGNNLIVGTGGDDWMGAGGDASFIVGGKGNDEVYASSNFSTNSVMLYEQGDGQDTVYINRWSSTSTLLFGPDVDPASLKIKLFRKPGSPSWDVSFDIEQDMLIEYGGEGDTVTVFGAVPDSGGEGGGGYGGAFTSSFIGGGEDGYGGEIISSHVRIQFADGTVWSYADMLAHAQYTLVADPNNPVLLGTVGNDTYVVGDLGAEFTIVDGAGDGNFNTVELGWDYASGVAMAPVADRVTLEDEPFSMAVSATQIPPYVLTRVGGSLSVQFDNGTTLNIDGFDPADPLGSSAIREFKFTDGTVLSIAQILEAGIEATGTDGNDEITGTAVNDIISGLSGNDTITGGKGNDVLRGGTGNDTYVFTSGDGADTIEDASFYWGQQQLVLDSNVLQLGAGIDPSSVTVKFDADSGKVYLDMGPSTGSGQVRDTVVIGEPGNFSVQSVVFDDAAGTVWDEWMMTDLMTVGSLASPAPAQPTGITYSAVLANGAALPAWLSFDSATGKFSGTPTNDDVATLAVSVTASDTSGNSTTSNFALDVLNVNDAPTVSVELSNQATLEDAAFSFAVPAGTFDDVDFIHGDTLSYFAMMDDGSALPDWLKFDTYTQTFSGTPGNSEVGTYSVTVTATDTGGLTASSTFSVDVANVNDTPTVSVAIADQATLEDVAFSYTVPAGSFDDVDAIHGDELTYSAMLADGTALPSWLIFDAATQTFSGTPGNFDVGAYSVTVSATDTGGLSASSTFAVDVANVNDTPTVAMPIANQATLEDAAFSFTVPAGSFDDIDFIHGDALTYSATLADGTALPGWLTFDAATQTFGGTPGNAEVGAYSVTVTATDIAGLAASSTFAVNVVNVNDAPTVSMPIVDQTTLEDAAFSFTVPAGTFADVDAIHGDVLAYTATRADGTALPSWLTFDAATQTFSGTPLNEDVGNLSVLVTATDTGGLFANTAFSVTIINVNDTPTVSMAIAPQFAFEDTAFSFTVPADTFTDVDLIHGDTLTYSATLADGTALPVWMTFDAATQTFNGTALNEDVGNLNVLVTATDSAGLSASSAFVLNVINVNDAPTAYADAGVASEDAGALLLDAASLLANDTDPDFIHGDALNIVGVTQAASGAAVSVVNGNVQYNLGNVFQSLAQGQTTTDTFSYTVSDTAGATSTATVSMTIAGVNDAAVTVDDTASVQEDGVVTASGNVLANDSDVDQGAVLTIASAGTLPGNYGSLVLNTDGGYSYLLDNASLAVQSLAAGQVVTETFSYLASDGIAITPATLTVSITGINDAPVAAIPLSKQTATETGTFVYQLPAHAFTDIDQGDTLTYTATMADGTALPAWLLFDAASMSFSSTLEMGAAGLWDINVTATDPSGASASSNFTLDIAKLIKGGCEEDDLQGTALRDVMYGLNEDDILRGHAGDDVLVGGSGNDILEGGTGNDLLIGGVPDSTLLAGAPVLAECVECEDEHDDDSEHASESNEHDDEHEYAASKPGNNLLNGGEGNDTLMGGARDDMLIGGTGNDIIDTGAGRDIIAFNKGDGQDTVLAPSTGSGQTCGADNTLSLGGGIKTGDLSFRHLGNDLVLEVGAAEQITFSDWYASSANRSILNLQLIDAISNTHDDDDEDEGAHIARFDFSALVAYFDQAVAADSTTDHWALTNASLDAHLEQSKGAALGGDLAYQYGASCSLAGVSLTTAQDIMGNSAFGAKAQKLNDLPKLKDGVVMLD